MNIEKESEITVQAINKTINEFKEFDNKKKYRTEAVIQFRLYQHICNQLCNESDKTGYKRISGECSPFETKNLKEYAAEIKKRKKSLPYMDHIYQSNEYNINKDIKTNKKKKELAKEIIKQGKYDITIFNQKRNKIQHVIEIKKIKEPDIFPEGSKRHLALEDIYELSDYINSKKYHKNLEKDIFKHDFSKIDKECRAYNIMFICKEWKRKLSAKNSKKYEKIIPFLNDVKKAYEKSKIYYLSIGMDDCIENDIKKHPKELDDLQCGEGTKYRL